MARTSKSRPLPPEVRLEEDSTGLEEIWGLLEAAAPGGDGDPGETDAAWARLEATMAARGEASGPAPSPDAGIGSSPGRAPSPRSRWARGSWLAAAAMAALSLAGGALLARITVEAPPGSTAMVALPDGSTVELNSGSTLRHARWGWGSWRGSREVTLEGEAYFQVTPGDRPFQVRTFDAHTVVLGTRFNLRARPEFGGGTEVRVVSGRVRVDGAGPAAGVELSAGEGARVRNGVASPEVSSPEAVDRALSWRERGFSVSELPLGAILAELERRFDVRIETGEAVRLEDTLTLHYGDPRDLRALLGDISTARGLRFRTTNGGYELY